MMRLPHKPILVHILIWMGLVVAAYATAGPYRFASCWGIILIYVPPAAILLLAIAGLSLVVLLAAIFYPALQKNVIFSIASHGMVLTVGLIGCNGAAYAGAGQVSCL